MNTPAEPSDLELAALISSKICHDVISPVGAIYNGLEILGEDDDPKSRAYAMDVIRNVTVQASARLQFARFAFGAAGSAGAEIDLQTARDISEGCVGGGKHELSWQAPMGMLPKNQVKLLLNLIALSINALPRGGSIAVTIGEDLSNFDFVITCTGRTARPPKYLAQIVAGEMPEIDAMSVQAYYTWRLAANVGATIAIEQDGEAVVITARRGM
jgi:histidine phosphotransferase ChpT